MENQVIINYDSESYSSHIYMSEPMYVSPDGPEAWGRTLTEISDLTPNMLGGSYRHRALRLKGMECWGVFLYLPHLLAEFRGTLGVEFHVWRDASFGVIEHVEGVTQGSQPADPEVVQLLQRMVASAPRLPPASFDKMFNAQVPCACASYMSRSAS